MYENIKQLYKDCLTCSKSFTDKQGTYGKKWENKKYCSLKCSSIAQKGVTKLSHTEEFKKKVSERHKGKVNSEETKKKMAIGKMGDRNPNWRNGSSTETQCIRNSAEYRLWRGAVFTRDNYVCIFCGIKGGWSKEQKRQIEIHADHIKPFGMFPELRFAIDNGRTLCVDCHKKTPTWGFSKKQYNQ